MKVRVDATRCQAYGTCAIHLPQVFKLDEWGYATTEAAGLVPGGLEEAARKAILDCPERAITADEE